MAVRYFCDECTQELAVPQKRSIRVFADDLVRGTHKYDFCLACAGAFDIVWKRRWGLPAQQALNPALNPTPNTDDRTDGKPNGSPSS
jgi:hypothetical protein